VALPTLVGEDGRLRIRNLAVRRLRGADHKGPVTI
jgi:hypothetical protein